MIYPEARYSDCYVRLLPDGDLHVGSVFCGGHPCDVVLAEEDGSWTLQAFLPEVPNYRQTLGAVLLRKLAFAQIASDDPFFLDFEVLEDGSAVYSKTWYEQPSEGEVDETLRALFGRLDVLIDYLLYPPESDDSASTISVFDLGGGMRGGRSNG